MQRNYLKIALRNLTKNKVYLTINYLNNTKNLNNMKKKFLSSGFVLAGVCLFAFFSVNAQSDKAVTNTEQVYKISGRPGLNGTTHTFVDGKEYYITVKNGTVNQLLIDNNEIPAEKVVDYKTVLDKVFYKFTHEQAKRDGEQAARDKEQAARDREQAMRDKEQAVRDKEQAARDEEQAMRDKEQAARDKEQAMRDKEQAVRDKEQAVRDKEQAVIDKRESRLMEKFIEELIIEKIIKNRKELDSFQLSDSELIVNGIKQSTALHEKLRDKYVTNKSLIWMYNIEHH
jgi:colicin import membrane protein